MDYKYIEQLLERYWQCETSLEEESELRAFFSEGEIPAHLLQYRDLFVYQQVQRETGLGEDFDARILAQVEPPVVKARRLTLVGRRLRLLLLCFHWGVWRSIHFSPMKLWIIITILIQIHMMIRKWLISKFLLH